MAVPGRAGRLFRSWEAGNAAGKVRQNVLKEFDAKKGHNMCCCLGAMGFVTDEV